MALTPAVLNHGIHTTGGTPVVTGSVTPTAGLFWLLFVHSAVLTAGVAPSVPTVTGLGGTWTTPTGGANPYDSAGGAEARTDLFRCADASTTGTLSIAYPGQVPDDVTWCLVEITGANPTGGPSGNGIVQVVTAVGTTTNPSVTLAALASPLNAAFGFLGSESDHSTLPITPGGSLTELAIDFQVASAARDQAETEWAVNVTTVNWTCAATNSWGATALEVAAAAAINPLPLLSPLTGLGIPGRPPVSQMLATGVEPNALGYVTPLPISQFLNPLSLVMGPVLFPIPVPYVIPASGGNQPITPDTGINATSSMSGAVQKLAAITPAALNATSTVSGGVSKLARITPASVSSTSAVGGTVSKLAAIKPSSVSSTSTVSGAVVRLAPVSGASVSATSPVTATLSGGSGARSLDQDRNTIFIVTNY